MRQSTGRIRTRAGTQTLEAVFRVPWHPGRIVRSTGYAVGQDAQAKQFVRDVLADLAVEQRVPAAVAPRKQSGLAEPWCGRLRPILDKLREVTFGMDEASGVYLLLRAGSVLYVGKSAKVRSRAGAHMRTKGFDRALYLPLEPERLKCIEDGLIAMWRPPLNYKWPSYMHEGHRNRLREIGFENPQEAPEYSP